MLRAEDLVNEYAKKVEAGEMTLEQVQKDLQEKAKQKPEDIKKEEVTAIKEEKVVETKPEVKNETTVTTEAPKKDIKIAGNLFKPFTLGSILTPGPTGNMLSNTKAKGK